MDQVIVPGYKLVRTLRGDSLQRIAEREMGDAALWYTLIDFNDLLPPYLVDDPALVRTGVRLTGAQMKIPTSSAMVIHDEATDDVFGQDVRLTGGLLTADAGGDIDIIAGVDNLKQALTVLLETDPGELVFHARYGCSARAFIGASNLASNALVAGSIVKQAVAADPRVRSILDAQVTVSGDSVQISVTAEAINSVPVTAEVL